MSGEPSRTENSWDETRTMTPLEQLTVVPLHSEPDPTPTTLMGLQSRPSGTLTSCSTTPSRPRRAAPAAEFACRRRGERHSGVRAGRGIRTDSVLLQHAVVGVPWADVAAARRASESMA